MDSENWIETALNIRWVLIVLELPGIYEPKSFTLISQVLDKLMNIKKDTESLLINWINQYSKEQFTRLTFNLRKVLNDLVTLYNRLVNNTT